MAIRLLSVVVCVFVWVFFVGVSMAGVYSSDSSMHLKKEEERKKESCCTYI